MATSAMSEHGLTIANQRTSDVPPPNTFLLSEK
jgi:hypothetical protein